MTTSHTGRLYALALSLVVFFLAWAVVAAHPWGGSSDPRLKALAEQEAQLRREAAVVRQVVSQRQASYRAQLRARNAQIAAAGASSAASATSSPVQVVNLPPLTITRTS